jgi:hypothetical protein
MVAVVSSGGGDPIEPIITGSNVLARQPADLPGPLHIALPKGPECEVVHTRVKQDTRKLTIQVSEVIWG